MKRKTKIIIGSVAGVLCVLAVVVAFLSVGRAGGEIGFEATINQIENGVAYATVTADDAGFGAPKLPKEIEFVIDDLGELNAGDEIHGCYLRGTIDGRLVRVVSALVKTE